MEEWTFYPRREGSRPSSPTLPPRSTLPGSRSEMPAYTVQGYDPNSKSEYSMNLRYLCHMDAELRVPKPTTCPRCGCDPPSFSVRMTYKKGSAGFWNCWVSNEICNLWVYRTERPSVPSVP